ncbi:MAG: disulfide reductase [Desulfobacteraceae bacterium IS3]|nr:MAG: disulfide reductase [Desulfobacteraceae bacterium IS3]
MKYLYYPGCSLEGTAAEYHHATEAFMQAVGAELTELKDWICCGASAAESTSYLLSLALPAVNLAIAENTDKDKDILVPCSACYLNLKRAEDKIQNDSSLSEKINTILAEKNLKVKGQTRVRHLLDVIVRDIGTETVRKLLKKRLTGMSVAPYYGCQCLRPYPVFDDPEKPRSMEPLIEAAGASVHTWDMGGKCCGASHINTKPETALQLVSKILKAAKGADAVVTVCPMCQMNLEAYQRKISSLCNEDLKITILYLPQLLGLALGISEKELRLDLNLSVTDTFRKKWC